MAVLMRVQLILTVVESEQYASPTLLKLKLEQLMVKY